MTVTTPAIVAAAPAAGSGAASSAQAIIETISAGGNLQIAAPTSGSAASATNDLGAGLTLIGKSVDVTTRISLPISFTNCWLIASRALQTWQMKFVWLVNSLMI